MHTARPAVLKWVARVRAGALATGARCAGTGLHDNPRCLCCGADQEDDEHAVAGCPATGSADWRMAFPQIWTDALREHGLAPSPLSDEWLEEHRLPLAAALLPLSIRGFLRRQPEDKIPAVLRTFHLGLAEWLAEILRRREELVALARAAAARLAAPADPLEEPARKRPAWATAQRQLSVGQLRELERQPPAPLQQTAAVARPSGNEERRLDAERRRVAAQTLHDCVKQLRAQNRVHPAPLEEGEPSVALLLLWEADKGAEYPSGATALSGRLTTFSKRLAEAVEADDELRGWLHSGMLTRSLANMVNPYLWTGMDHPN